MDNKTYVVAVDVKTVYHVTVKATCVAKAEKLANQLQTSWIRKNGELIDVTSEVVGVKEEGECEYCGQHCFEDGGQGCDEAQAGGFHD